MSNEFEDLPPEQTVSDVPGEKIQDDSLIANESQGAGKIYDWSKAPDQVRAPPRVDMEGKEVIIKKVEIIIPPESQPWELTRNKDKECKRCTLKLFYDYEGQQEFLSGLRIFKPEPGREAHPSFTRDRKNQASELLGLYADFKKKDINEVTLREIMGYLNSQPKVVIKVKSFTNPNNGEIVKKNLPGKFI